jgi:hypothetical protein
MDIGQNGSRKHLRRLGVAVAVVAAAASAGTYLGLSATGDPGSSATGYRGPHAPGAAPRSSALAADPATGATGDAAGSSGSGAVACPMIPSGVDQTSGSGSVGGSTHLFSRTTADGVTIRAYLLPATTGSCGCAPIPQDPTTSSSAGSSASSSSGAAPADVEVGGDGSVSVEMSDTTAVGQGSMFDYPGPTGTTVNAGTEPVDTTTGAFGITEGAPVWWTAVSVGPEVASAEMTFADGSTDRMSPVDGIAVLADQIDPSVAAAGDGPYAVRGTLRLLDASGAVITTVTLPQAAPTPVSPPGFVSPPVAVAGTAKATPVPDLPSVPVTSAPNTSTAVSGSSTFACPETTTPVQAPKAVYPRPATVG